MPALSSNSWIGRRRLSEEHSSMTAPREEQDVDSLSSLEERISRTVELVVSLRKDNQDLTHRLETTIAERDTARAETLSALEQNERLDHQLEELRAERQQVRARIQK